MGPTRFERAHHRPRRWVLPGYTKGPVVVFRGFGGSLIRAGNRRLGDALTTGGRAPRPSGSRGASARGAGPRGSVSSGIKSPPSLFSCESGQSESNAHRRIYSPECCRYTTPRQTSEPQNTESSRSQYAGKPAAGRFGFFVAMRVMVLDSREPGLFQCVVAPPAARSFRATRAPLAAVVRNGIRRNPPKPASRNHDSYNLQG